MELFLLIVGLGLVVALIVTLVELRRLDEFSAYLKRLMDEGKAELVRDQEYMTAVLKKFDAQELTEEDTLVAIKTFDQILLDSLKRVRELELLDISASFKKFNEGYLLNWDYASMVVWKT